MKHIHAYILTGFIAVFGGGLVGAVAMPAQDVAACNPDARMLGFPHWYRGVVDANCEIDAPNQNEAAISEFVWGIVMNIVEILLVAVSYLAVAFIIYGGFLLMTSAGTPDRRAQGQKAILQASVGLVIALISIAAVSTLRTIMMAGYGADAAGAEAVLEEILRVVYLIAGFIAVIVIVVSGIFYTTSAGDPAKTKRAKDALLYAVIGLAVVGFAFAITSFILGRF